MKTVTVVKVHSTNTYGWHLPRNTEVTCQCIYAKLKDSTIYDQDLIDCIRETFPDDKEKQLSTYKMIERIDRKSGTLEDLSNLKELAKKLNMRVIVRK